MKTFKKIFLVILSVLMIAVSCAKIDGTYRSTTIPTNDKGEYAILFNNSSVVTKAAINTTAGNGYDEFSLYAWNSSNDTIMNPYKIVATGQDSYGYDKDLVDGQELQYFKNNTNNYEFIGVIPTTDVNVKNGAVKIERLESFVVDDNRVLGTLVADSPKEFLWTYKKVEKSNYGNVVELPFNHGNAVVYLGFSSNKNTTKLLDYTPSKPEVPATPDTETYTKKTTKFIDELVAGNEVQVAIGFYGVNSPKLTKNQPNPLYVGADNTSNGYLAKTWLLSIKDAVNSQFVYYRLNSIVNSTSKTETTEDWESAASNKNIFMMKLADGVDKAAFAAGNDAFATALKAHQTDWVGGSPAESFWAMFEQAYADGWRVVRINVSDANASQVLVFLSSNIETSTQVCTITPGDPGSPAVTGINGIRVFSADSLGINNLPADTLYCKHVAHTTKADATISSTGCVLSNRSVSNEVIQFSLPTTTTLSSTPIWSPTTFYALPGDDGFNFIVVKFSYEYDGEKVYDVRVPIKLPAGGLQPGKYYKYEIYITSTANGTNDPTEAEKEKDEILIENNSVINIKFKDNGYTEGDDKKITI